ncbi:MAG: sigma-70 family RNA polymerase sigma factor [Verrucomicrobiales bacterium]|nr:sigma-70 family RNA polymerase sigma factor [Verrucomicrobiales bacterium]
MNDQTDSQLLRAYAEHRSETAFAELVRRRVDFVYSAALRMVCDSHLAQDVTQAVFVALAKNATQLMDRPVLSGWLHRTAQNIAAQTVRADVRRRAREQEAAAMHELLSAEPDTPWEHIAPHLDAALGELSEPDRDALLLRYFERKSAREIAQVLGTSDDAAQKRVSRAVERLREFFAKRSVTVGASGLGVVISANAIQAAPVGLAVTISTAAALAGTSLATAATVTTTKAIAMTTLQKAILGAALAAAVGTGIYQSRQASGLRKENQKLIVELEQAAGARDAAVKQLAALSTKPAPRLPTPRRHVTAQPAGNAGEDSSSTNLIAQLLRGNEAPKLTTGQLESYLKENQRSPASLLAAYRTTGDRTLLDEAIQKFPNDPQVAFEAAFQKDASAEEQRQWLDALKQSAPSNALADYLSAAHHFKAGQPDQAVEDLMAASGKPQFQDYTLERVQDDEEAYRAAGYSVAEAKTIPSMQLLLPQLAQMKELSQNLTELAKSYRQTGDEPSAQAVLQMAAGLGQRYSQVSPGEPEISQLVGIAIERMALNAMEANSPYGSDGRTVKDRLEQLAQQNADLWQLAKQTEALMPKMTDQDWISCKDRWRNFGEEAAGRWLIKKYGEK